MNIFEIYWYTVLNSWFYILNMTPLENSDVKEAIKICIYIYSHLINAVVYMLASSVVDCGFLSNYWLWKEG
jgi:hypothetical protein